MNLVSSAAGADTDATPGQLCVPASVVLLAQFTHCKACTKIFCTAAGEDAAGTPERLCPLHNLLTVISYYEHASL